MTTLTVAHRAFGRTTLGFTSHHTSPTRTYSRCICTNIFQNVLFEKFGTVPRTNSLSPFGRSAYAFGSRIREVYIEFPTLQASRHFSVPIRVLTCPSLTVPQIAVGNPAVSLLPTVSTDHPQKRYVYRTRRIPRPRYTCTESSLIPQCFLLWCDWGSPAQWGGVAFGTLCTTTKAS